MKPEFEQYLIKPNHRMSRPKKVIYLDTETDRFAVHNNTAHYFKLGWTCYIIYDKRYKYHTPQWKFHGTAEGLCKYIEDQTSEKETVWVYAHNAFFDLQAMGFYERFTEWGWKLDFYYDKGLTYILCIHKGKRRLKAVSSTNYYACSLKVLGDLIGVPKGEVDFDTVDRETLSEYCKNDVLILKKGIEYYFQFVADNDLGKVSLTKSSQAFNAYRHAFMRKKLYRHTNPEVINLERSAYMGGRCECFHFGVQPVDVYLTLDINSMYPYVMKTYPLPTRLLDYVRNPLPQIVRWALRKHCVIAECMIETDEPAYGVQRDHKMIFPVGRFTTFLCTGGLQYALEHGHLKHVKRLALYQRDYIFGTYVDFFYDLRKRYEKQGNEVMATLAKYLMNSLYGKFGQRETIETREVATGHKPYERIENYDLVTGEHWIEYTMFNTHVIRKGERESRHSIVSIPAHITEYARFLLWDIIRSAGRDNVYYCDTDSVKIRYGNIGKIIYPRHQDRIGSLKREEIFIYFEIRGNKHYLTSNERRIKGVPRSAIRIKPNVYEYDEFMGQAQHLREGVSDYFMVKRVQKDVTPMYDKAEILPNGCTAPFLLSEF